MPTSTGGVKRKRFAYDDGFRVPTVQQSYLFAEPVVSRVKHPQNLISTFSKPNERLPASKRDYREGRPSSSISCSHPFSASKRGLSVSPNLSSVRQESWSMSLCNQGRQRESSTFNSRSSILEQEGLSKSKRKSNTAFESASTKCSSANLSFPASTTSSSSSSLLPAHLRPSAINDQDLLSAERYASSLRLLATWESIALKYADIDPEEDAEIDIATGRIVRGKDKVARMPDRVIGGTSESDEEAKETRTKENSIRAKGDSDKCQQTATSNDSELFLAVYSPTLDEEASEASDIDELDTWDKDEMEIQIEALPLSHTTKPRTHRPWTADDDVDLQEFMRAEERRRALFGDIDEEEDRDREEEENDARVNARVMDKEEAMSRRTIHASIPYFPPDYQASPVISANPPQRGSTTLKGVSLDESSESTYCETQEAEDELGQLFETLPQLPNLERCNPIFDASRASSPIPQVADSASTYLRQSSPSSASSYLMSHHTDGANSSNEGTSIRKHNHSRDPYTSPRLEEEDICERALLGSSFAEPDEVADDTNPYRQFVSSPCAEPIKRLSFYNAKRSSKDDEARYTPEYPLELVVEVPMRNRPAVRMDTGPFPIIAMPDEDSCAMDQPGLRRSSRRAVQGKSYALRKKRNRRPLQRKPVVYEDETGLNNDHPIISSASPLAERAFPLSLPEGEMSNQVLADAAEIDNSTFSLLDSSRSPSVVEGTPEPASPHDFSSLGLSSIHNCFFENGRQASSPGLQSETVPIGCRLGIKDATKQCTTPAIVQEGLGDFAFPQLLDDTASPVNSNLAVVEQQIILMGAEPISAQPCVPDADYMRRATTSHSQSENRNTGRDVARNGKTHLNNPVLLPNSDTANSFLESHASLHGNHLEATTSARPIDVTDLEDDEDILLLGATFEDEAEIIWPEIKPDILPPDVIPPTQPEDPTAVCEMSFRSVKGEKKELSTFTAPFRCSRIIDLTGDDICDDDEHDELDEWSSSCRL